MSLSAHCDSWLLCAIQYSYLLVYTHTRLTALFRDYPGKPVPERQVWILLKQVTVSGSGISWAICKSAPRFRQTTTPAPHRSVFTGRVPFLPPNQQRQSTEGRFLYTYLLIYCLNQSNWITECKDAAACYRCSVVCAFVDTSVSPTKQLNRSRCRLGCGFGWTQGTTWGQIPSTGVGNLGEGHPCDAPFRQKSLTTCLWLL